LAIISVFFCGLKTGQEVLAYRNRRLRWKTSTQEVLAYPKPAHKVENAHARSSREPETRSKGGKRARKKLSRTRNPLQRWKTRTQEALANPKPAHKVENEHARSSREPETGAKGRKRARKKFSRTRSPLQRGKTRTQEALANPKPAPKGENAHARRSREPETRSKGGKRARKKFSRTQNPHKKGKTRTQKDQHVLLGSFQATPHNCINPPRNTNPKRVGTFLSHLKGITSMNHDDKDLFEEPPIEDFFRVEEVSEKELKRKKRRQKGFKVGAVILALFLLINGLAIWTNVINIPALQFVKTSYRLSQKETIQIAKQAVVKIEGENSKGTGFNIREDGLIITNSHVIEKMITIKIYFPNGQAYKGEVILDNPDLDVAILEIKGENLPVLKLQETPNWKEKQHIYVIGNPLAYTQIANEGEIEGLTLINDRQTPVMQISAPVYRGNSGSPVLTENNEVIGLVYATTIPKLASNEKASGLAVPIEQVKEVLEQLD
jgi:serine protease Do